MAVEYGTNAGAVLSNAKAVGGSAAPQGGAGTVYLKGSSSTYGDLIVDNGNVNGQSTELPGLGSGAAQAGSGGSTLVTDRSATIPGYFVGHWVEASTSTGDLKGTYRIASIGADGRTVTLVTEPAGGSVSVDPGDLWQGVHRFDTLRVTGKAKVNFNDRVDAGTVTIDPGSSVSWYDAEAPMIDPTRVSFSAAGGSFWVAGASGAVTDPDEIGSAKLRNLRTTATWPVTVSSGGSFAPVPVAGTGNDSIQLEATDAHSRPRTGSLVVGSLPVNAGPPTVVAAAISVAAHDSAFWVAGGDGAVSDPNGIASAQLANPANGQTWSVTIAADGSFAWTAVAGTSGQRLTLTARDSHPDAMGATEEIQALPANAAPPVIAAGLIQISEDTSGRVHVTGGVGAVQDPETPVRVTVTNVTAGGTSTGVAIANGAFDVIVSGTAGDSLRLEATDSHPQPATSTLDLGRIPGWNLGPPTVNVALVTIGARDSHYLVTGASGAVTDPDGVDPAGVIHNPTSGQSWPATINADGSFGTTTVAGQSGEFLTLEAKDRHPQPQTAVVTIGTLPANAAGPAILVDKLSFTEDGAGKQYLDGAAGAVADPETPINLVVRDVPQDKEFMGTAAADGSFRIEVSGTPGDLIRLQATDSHPTPLSTTVDVGALPANAAPSVDRGLVSITYEGQVSPGVRAYVLHLAAGAITDAQSPIHLVLTNGRSGVQGEATLQSGAALDWHFQGDHRLGDAMTLGSTDSHPTDPKTTVVDLGTLPGNPGPAIDTAAIAITFSGAVGDPNSAYVVHIGSGAITDGEPPVLLELHNPRSHDLWHSTIDSGAAVEWRLTGGANRPLDSLDLIATDSHPTDPQATTVQIGPLPDGNTPPVVDTGALTFTYEGLLDGTGRAYTLHVPEGAITDEQPPIDLVLTDKRSGASWQTTIDSGTALEWPFDGDCIWNDLLELRATDSHPDNPLTRVVEIGPLPGNVPPAVNGEAIRVTYEAGVGEQGPAFVVHVSAGAIVDAHPPIELDLLNERSGDVRRMSIESGAATDWRLDGMDNREGDVLELRATDSHPSDPQATTVKLPPLGAENLPPVLDAAGVAIAYEPGNATAPYALHVAAGAITDSHPPLHLSLRNARSGSAWQTPVGSGEALDFPLANGDNLGGDLVELTVTDSHPTAPTSSTMSFPPLAGNRPPLVDGTAIAVGWDGDGIYVVSILPGAIVDDDPPIQLELHNLRSGWTVGQTIGSGAGSEWQLDGLDNQHGDVLELKATDSNPTNPRTTILVLPALPIDNPMPAIDRRGISVTFDPGSGGADAAYVAHFYSYAIVDEQPPVHLALRNLRSGSAWQTTNQPWDRLDWRLAGGDNQPGDVLELKATDSHTEEPATRTVRLDPLPPMDVPQADTSRIKLMRFGFKYQVAGTPGAVAAQSVSVTVTITNTSSGWSATFLANGDGSLYSRIEGAPGDPITLVLTDGASHSSGIINLGGLPDAGVTGAEIWEHGFGHSVTAVKHPFVIVDGGHAVGWVREEPLTDATLYPGLTAARDVVYNLKLKAPMALDGGSLVAWTEQGSPPVHAPRALQLSSGTLVRAQVRGDELYTVAEEAEGIRLFTLELVTDQSGAWAPDCGAPVHSVLLPGTVGLHAFEILPAGDGKVAVLSDDPAGELRLVDATDTGNLAALGTVDLPGNASQSWGVWQTGELYVGRADGSVEIWRWGDSGPERYAAWSPQQGKVVGAGRYGDELWVGLDTGSIQQIDLVDPAQPRWLGEYDFGEPIVAFSRAETASLLRVATPARYFEVPVDGMGATVSPDLVSWGHGGGQSWATIGFEIEWVSSDVTWSDGQSAHGSDCHTCDAFNPAEVSTAPTFHVVDGDGIPVRAYTPPQARLRRFDRVMGSDFWSDMRASSDASCNPARDVVGGIHSTVNVVYGATGGEGRSEIAYTSVDEPTGLRQVRQLNSNGPLEDLFQYNNYIVACDNGLTVWDPDPARGGNSVDPVRVQQIDLFGGDPVVAAKAVFWGPLLMGADDPGRYAAINPDPWGSDSSAPQFITDGAALPSLEGHIRDLHACHGDLLYVLTDAGSAGRLYKYSIAVPTAPALAGQFDFMDGAPAVSLFYRTNDESTAGTEESLLVARRGWGIEFLSLDLAPLSSVRLPGDTQAAFWDWGSYVLLGDFGIARVRGPATQPTIDYVQSNQNPPGNVVHRTSGINSTPEGPTW